MVIFITGPHSPGINLQRARTQLRLLESMEENAPEMEMIVKKIYLKPTDYSKTCFY
jgi:hypothetical protein